LKVLEASRILEERLRVDSLNPEYRALQKMFLSLKLDFVSRMLKKRYVILMYHSTPVSASWVYDVGKNYFKEQIEYVSNNYDVLSISSIVERSARARSWKKNTGRRGIFAKAMIGGTKKMTGLGAIGIREITAIEVS